MKYTVSVLLSLVLLFVSGQLDYAKSKEKSPKEKDTDLMNSGTFSGLELRLIGPALTSGRITDIAVNPNNKSEFYIGVACGHVWKTTNGGISFAPVFDGQPSFSIGCVVIDPANPFVVWVGTGENNSQRSVSYGDGVYKSLDGGKSWKNMGLKKSEHIGKIVIDPKNSNTIYVAAQGPLWASGGERGLCKSTDGGQTWEQSLKISDNTGVTDIAIDPRNPEVLYAASYQRRRHVWTLIDGGPESAIYKTTDAGKTWNKMAGGLPRGDLGKIGIAISPVNPDVIYATIEATEGGGFFRSTDRGASWEKRNPWFSGAGQYYQELICDPKDVDLVYNLDTRTQVTNDAGKTFTSLSNNHRHVDDHALWIDPAGTDHILIGCDGGLYETFDNGANWRFFQNLPVTQFYRVCTDNSEPFYFVYGGTQDNNTWGGPSRTTNPGGITNEDWFLVVGGDGYQARVDPTNPDIVYAQWQYGNLIRYDRKSGEVFYIQPQPGKGEEIRWNWDTPLIISNHSPTRIYIAANKLFRSDDRGQSWKSISPDLTRQIDRNKLEVMGKIWSPEAVAKNASTSLYGNIVALSESPKNENLVFVGTDDGLIQYTIDAGQNWNKIDKFAGVPETTYVSDIFTSQFDENIVYATFDNHKMADFKPYIMKSEDKGKTWKSISGNLPENGAVYTVYEDYVNPKLLFCGTEFGLFFTIDGGEKWIQLKNGMPTIAVKDLEIQKRENDLVVGTFGRGIYIIDDYTPLRTVTPEMLQSEITVFPIKDALMYNEDESRSKGDQGEMFWRAKNPAFGATFTYYMKEGYKTKKDIRKEEAKKAEKDNKPVEYPPFSKLIEEDKEEAPQLIFKILDESNNMVRVLTGAPKAGISRITWDLRYPDSGPVSAGTDINKNSGIPVMPGKYKLIVFKSLGGMITKISDTVSFNTKILNNSTLPAKNREELAKFQKKVARLQHAVMGCNELAEKTKKDLEVIRKALMSTPGVNKGLLEKVRKLDLDLLEITNALTGNRSIAKRNENQPPSITDRLYYIITGVWATSSEPTQTQKDAYKIAGEELTPVLSKLRTIAETEINELNKEMDKLGSPWTPGRIPDWKME